MINNIKQFKLFVYTYSTNSEKVYMYFSNKYNYIFKITIRSTTQPIIYLRII